MTLETVKADFVGRVGMCWCLISEAQNLTDNWTGTSIFSVVFSLCIYARLVYSTVNSFTRIPNCCAMTCPYIMPVVCLSDSMYLQ